tara:strand:+ start:581 stop:922 length:342 start_codon:yes stop_codon:yes gene_type:complete
MDYLRYRQERSWRAYYELGKKVGEQGAPSGTHSFGGWQERAFLDGWCRGMDTAHHAKCEEAETLRTALNMLAVTTSDFLWSTENNEEECRLALLHELSDVQKVLEKESDGSGD